MVGVTGVRAFVSAQTRGFEGVDRKLYLLDLIPSTGANHTPTMRTRRIEGVLTRLVLIDPAKVGRDDWVGETGVEEGEDGDRRRFGGDSVPSVDWS